MQKHSTMISFRQTQKVAMVGLTFPTSFFVLLMLQLVNKNFGALLHNTADRPDRVLLGLFELNMERNEKIEINSEKGSTQEPGAARFGNFINYYQFNPAGNRIVHLEDFVALNKSPPHCLDIGCNSGVSK